MLKKLLLAGFALVAAIAIPALAQQWPNIPIIGGASYCASTVNNTCVSTVPAGPTALTGAETVPADTNISGGASPQTAKIPIGRLGAGPTTFVDSALTASSTTVTNRMRRLVIIPAADIASYTVVFPASTTLTAADNQLFSLCSTQTITGLTLTAGAGTTLSPPIPTILTESTTTAYCYEWVYRLSNTTWYRTQ